MGHARQYQLRGAGGLTKPLQPVVLAEWLPAPESVYTLSGSTVFACTSFTLAAPATLTGALIWLRRSGSQSGAIVCGIFDDAAGEPGTLLTSPGGRDWSSLPTAFSWWQSDWFPRALPASTVFWLVFGKTPGAGVIERVAGPLSGHNSGSFNGAWAISGIGLAHRAALLGYPI